MERNSLIGGVLALAVFAQIHAASAQSAPPPFPLLGAYLIQPEDYTVVANINKIGILIISGWPGMTQNGKTTQQMVTTIKASNPNIKITQYENIDNMYNPDQAFQTEINALNTNNWWRRTTSPGGGITSTFGGTTFDINPMAKTLTAGGQTMLQWFAAYHTGWITTASPALDGIYTDNYLWKPRRDADYLENGTTQSQNNATIQQDWRNAYADWDAKLRVAMGSNYMHWGNTADWGEGSIQGWNQLLNGGDFENAIVSTAPGSGGTEGAGWSHMMNSYKIMMNALVPFKGAGPYLVFQQNQMSSTDYQALRYGFASCLLDNGYFFAAPGGNYNAMGWYDEFNFNLGAAIAGPNNPTNSTYSKGGLTVWQNGVWRRDFQNGIALVNPRGNGAQTVTLETTYKHFSGTQDPSVNNGQSVTSVTLNDRDGVILLRTSPQSQSVPDAPTLTVQ
jgi:hypothetical protein